MKDALENADAQARKTRIKELETLIPRYQASYYNGEAEISDAEFDKLWDELKALDSANPILARVGADSGNFPKRRHIMPMGSQEKVASPEEFLRWAARHDYPEYLVEYKLDGASLELQYEGGALARAVTRGDGAVGDEITANARKMRGVVGRLADAFDGAVRGEILMTHETHKALYADKANCRNAANGIMKRKDGAGCEHLIFVAYDAWAEDAAATFTDEEQKLVFLKQNGFDVVPLRVLRGAQSVIDYREDVMALREKLDYDIDGLVIKERRVDRTDASRARPERQIAFKFSLEEAVTTVRDIEWNESGATYTPVAVFDEVELNGTRVRRASLANPNLVRALGVRRGSRVVVVKRGEIIPKITRVLDTPPDAPAVEFPKVCGTCGTPLRDEGSRLYCPNKSCEKRVLHRLLKWVAVVDIRDLGETLVRALFRAGRVRSITDIYSLTVGDLVPYFLEDKSMAKGALSLGAQKVYSSIQSHRTVPLAKFVAGFDIEGIGETVVASLVRAGFDTLDALLAATREQIAAVYGFADTMAAALVEGLRDAESEMRALVSSGTIVIPEGRGGSLSGVSFCFTGELASMRRQDARALVEQRGGVVKSSVVKGLSYLVTNNPESNSEKNRKAKALGISVINEETFLAMLG